MCVGLCVCVCECVHAFMCVCACMCICLCVCVRERERERERELEREGEREGGRRERGGTGMKYLDRFSGRFGCKMSAVPGYAVQYSEVSVYCWL